MDVVQVAGGGQVLIYSALRIEFGNPTRRQFELFLLISGISLVMAAAAATVGGSAARFLGAASRLLAAAHQLAARGSHRLAAWTRRQVDIGSPAEVDFGFRALGPSVCFE